MREIVKHRIENLIDSAIQDGTTAGVCLLIRKENEELYFSARIQRYRKKGRNKT